MYQADLVPISLLEIVIID